jgi:hypothetical protein
MLRLSCNFCDASNSSLINANFFADVLQREREKPLNIFQAEVRTFALWIAVSCPCTGQSNSFDSLVQQL